jgi:hypothetical protein
MITPGGTAVCAHGDPGRSGAILGQTLRRVSATSQIVGHFAAGTTTEPVDRVCRNAEFLRRIPISCKPDQNRDKEN